MAKKNEIYKCELCGNIVEVFHGGAGDLVCCGEEMKLLEARTEDSSREKHVPFIAKADGGFVVKVGQVTAHPMLDNHFIEWIELLTDSRVCRTCLAPGAVPEAFFAVPAVEKVIVAREYCNVHGLWKDR